MRRRSAAVAAAIGLAATLSLASVSAARAYNGRGEEAQFAISRTRPLSAVVLRVKGNGERRRLALRQVRERLEQAGVTEIGAPFVEYLNESELSEVGWFVGRAGLEVPPSFRVRELPGWPAVWADVKRNDSRAWSELLRFALARGYMPAGPGLNIELECGRSRMLAYSYKVPEN